MVISGWSDFTLNNYWEKSFSPFDKMYFLNTLSRLIFLYIYVLYVYIYIHTSSMSYINKHVQELLQFNYRADIHPLNIHILSSERKTSVSSHSMIWTNGALNTHTQTHTNTHKHTPQTHTSAACHPLKGLCCAAVVMARGSGAVVLDNELNTRLDGY